MRLPEPLRGCRGAVIDTMVLIYLFEDHPRYGPACAWLMGRAEAGDYTGVVTPVTAAEIMVKPLAAQRHDLADLYRAAIRNAPNLVLGEFTCRTGLLAGSLRAQYRLPLPDMFQVAAAIEHGGVLVTNDAALRQVREIKTVLLEELVA